MDMTATRVQGARRHAERTLQQGGAYGDKFTHLRSLTQAELDAELWLPVRRCALEGRYEVSTLGRVYSNVKGHMLEPRWKEHSDGYVTYWLYRHKDSPCARGHLCERAGEGVHGGDPTALFELTKSGGNEDNYRREVVTGHALVVDAFIGALQAGEVRRHLNGVKFDNRLENLRIGDTRENRSDYETHRNQDREAAGQQMFPIVNMPRSDLIPVA